MSHSRSKSSRSPSSRKRKSVSRSPQKRGSKQKSNSYERDRQRRTPSYQRRRSPGRGPRRNPELIPKSSKLFVTNIDSSYPPQQLEDDLRKQFTRYGQIKQITVKTKRGSANSYCFVQFLKPEEAEAALTSMRGKDFKGKQLKVEFGKGQRKQEDRRADKCYICHKQGHFAKDCRYRERSRSRDRQDSRDHSRRKRYSRSSSSSRSPRRKRSYDRQREREYKRRDQRGERDYRGSPDRRRQRQYRGQRRQRY